MTSATVFLSFLLLLAAPLAAQESSESDETSESEPVTTPSQRAAESDYVALAQLDIYKYEEKREVPVGGASWFDVLVPYKVPAPIERLKVVEEGFGEGKCYFEDVELFTEMPRYLLFLVNYEDGDPGEVRGHPDGCALPIVITTDNQYVVRWPIENMRFEEDVESLVQEFEFQGPGAFIDLSDLVSYRREEEVERLHLVPANDDRGRREIYRYTRGIPLGTFRAELIGTDNLTKDRIQRGN
ncbi:hypothetical protein DZK25_06555 [Wenzhouxiangella sp. 15181]|uniref:hypothetical protein n=2 Tax=unclassified Wenzhouxiangella TaxID=2613841 RepID=UPI000E3AAFA3|nr:hypothetical protein [Wenzhouxiangella sp. 15181]RFF27672.1 hypothetical protein DZK25_06555 [Wenzhouxiangella sp. 15181]